MLLVNMCGVSVCSFTGLDLAECGVIFVPSLCRTFRNGALMSVPSQGCWYRRVLVFMSSPSLDCCSWQTLVFISFPYLNCQSLQALVFQCLS